MVKVQKPTVIRKQVLGYPFVKDHVKKINVLNSRQLNVHVYLYNRRNVLFQNQVSQCPPLTEVESSP